TPLALLQKMAVSGAPLLENMSLHLKGYRYDEAAFEEFSCFLKSAPRLRRWWQTNISKGHQKPKVPWSQLVHVSLRIFYGSCMTILEQTTALEECRFSGRNSDADDDQPHSDFATPLILSHLRILDLSGRFPQVLQRVACPVLRTLRLDLPEDSPE